MSDDAEISIRFDSVSKRYGRRHVDEMLLRELLPGHRHRDAEDEFWALRDLRFDVPVGEAVAILGANGSGKTTLLSMVAGACLPTEGTLSVRGRVAPMLGLGVGFELDMTAIENAFLNASLLGVGEEEVRDVLADIVAFADLGEFVDTPVRHFSSGMLARLGFAVAMHLDRDVLLVDEVLAVGDHRFQTRCLERVRELLEGGLTMLFVTHDLGMARQMCTRGIWLREGQVEHDGPIDECVERYESHLSG